MTARSVAASATNLDLRAIGSSLAGSFARGEPRDYQMRHMALDVPAGSPP
jgi:hypothetical protein